MANEATRSAQGFLTRLPNLDVVGQRILDLHRHRDALGLLLAERGAREVVSLAPRDLAEATADGPYDLVISRAGLGGANGADAHVTWLRGALAPDGTLVIAFSPRRRIAPRVGRDLTLGDFADVMARSRLHCTWYRVQRVSAQPPILRARVVSVWRQPGYDR